jgi:hypothetical protein
MVSDHGDRNPPDASSPGADRERPVPDPVSDEPSTPATETTSGTVGPDRVWLFVTGVLLLTMPAITLVVAYAALTATRSAVLAELTLVEAVELYLVELAAFAAFSYLLYRLTRYTNSRHAAAMDEREQQAGGDDARPEAR